MRLVVISSYAPSLVKFRGALLEDIVRVGHDVIALAPDFDLDSRNALKAIGVVPENCSLSRSGINPLGDLVDLLRLFLQIRRLKPDICLAYFVKPVIYGLIACYFAKVPRCYAMIEGAGYALMESQGGNSYFRRPLASLVRVLYRTSLRKARRVFFLNSDDQREFIERGLVASQRAFLLGPIGLDLHEYSPVPVHMDPVTFIFVGRLLQEKGIIEFVEAARSVKREFPGARFIVVGDSDVNPGAINRRALSADIEGGVIEWPGQVKDVRPWLAESTVFVLPSYREGMPRSTQEAMAMGRAVITTDVPGCRDTIEHGKSGLLVPARDAKALQAAMTTFLERPELAVQMGQRALARARENYDVHKVNAVIMNAMGI